jgi:carbamoyltransferase
MYTLGINAVYHDSAAALVKDGEVIAAAEEERFTHIKHGKRPIPFSTYELPFHAIDFCLKEAGIVLRDVDHVAYSYDPEALDPMEKAPWQDLFITLIQSAPQQLIDGVPHHLEARWRGLGGQAAYQWHFVEHHTAHAASGYLASPFKEAAVLTLDGRGEVATTSASWGENAILKRLYQVNMPHSLGLLYEQVTSYLGFLHSSDEYKVMALASYGSPVFIDQFRDIVRLESNGLYTLQPLRLEERFGPKRLRGSQVEKRHLDIAHSLQKVLEETVLEMARILHRQTRADALCLAGGVALNCVMNARIRDEGPFQKVWVQPAAGDAGTALGAALWIDARERPSAGRGYTMQHAFLGPQFEEKEIEQFMTWSKTPYRRMTAPAEEVAEILAQDKIIGWFQGRMEFGPRALGGRSILASPIHPEMQAKLNEIKDREDFRPVAPVVLEEEAGRWFATRRERTNGGASAEIEDGPFMLFVYDVRADKADLIPAVRHVDGTARVQTINRRQNAPYYDLLKAFQARTGIPVLVNTSFNTRGEPIVCTPRDALECFWTSPLDALVLGPYLVEKKTKKRGKAGAEKGRSAVIP